MSTTEIKLSVPVWQRVTAGVLDSIILFISALGGAYLLSFGVIFFLLRDAVGCPGIGKFIFNLGVINCRTGVDCNWKDSVKRNLIIILIIFLTCALHVFSKAGVIAGIGLFASIYNNTRDAAGRNLIDRFSGTTVVCN